MKLKKFLSHIYSNGRFFNIININKESICTNSKFLLKSGYSYNPFGDNLLPIIGNAKVLDIDIRVRNSVVGNVGDDHHNIVFPETWLEIMIDTTVKGTVQEIDIDMDKIDNDINEYINNCNIKHYTPEEWVENVDELVKDVNDKQSEN
jgi:hypothetical protein